MKKVLIKIRNFIKTAAKDVLKYFFIVILILLVASGANNLAKVTGINSETWVNAVATVLGALLGAYVAVYESLKVQRESTNKERKDEEKYSTRILLMFLRREINYNYNVIGFSSELNILKEERKLKFDEYEKNKYYLLKFPNKTMVNIINIYELLYNLNYIGNDKSNKSYYKILNRILSLKKDLDVSFNELEKELIEP